MNQQSHLTDREIEKYIEDSYSSGIDSEDFESHVAKCAHCRARLLQLERRKLGVLETGLGSATRTLECPAEEDLQKFVMGACAPDTAERIIQHVTDCSYCAPVLRAYSAAIEEPDLVPVPITFWQRLISAIQLFLGLSIWYKTAVAGGTTLVLAFLWPGPVLLNLYELHRAESFVAALSVKWPPSQMRTSWTPYPQGRFQTMGPPPAPTSNRVVAAANSYAAENSDSTDPRWLRLRGRVQLWHHEDDDATALFAAATKKGLDDPATEIDLAVAYFQSGIDNQGHGKPSFDKFSESLETLAKVLKEPNLNQQEKAIATFDLAVVYENMQLWGQAVSKWDEYLQLDLTGPWHDEAVWRKQKAEKAREKASSKPQGYREPAFFLRHFAEPDVQENLEEYQDIALRTWLLTAANHPDSPEALAVRELAQQLQDKYGDSWMHDFINPLSIGDLPALHALSEAITNNKQGRYTIAEALAREAALGFNKDGNDAGAKRARFEAIYAHQQLLQDIDCLKNAKNLEKEISARYTWLQVQLALEQAVCLNLGGKFIAAQEQIGQALQKASASNFHILVLRGHALRAAIDVANSCDETWKEVQTGLDLYWSGPVSAQRLYELISPVKQCFEKNKLWHAAELFEQRMITILEQEAPPDDKNVLLEFTAHEAHAQIFRELGDDEAARKEERTVVTMLDRLDKEISQSGNIPRVDKGTKLIYQVPIKLELAELLLDQGNTESALATMQEVKDVIDRSETESATTTIQNKIKFFHLKFFGLQGDIHLARQQWTEAEEDYKSGVENAEYRLHQFVSEDERKQWIEETGDVYRGLVEVFLQENRNEEALKLWEWYQARAFQQEPEPERELADPKWDQIEPTILTQPLPPSSVTRLVYASTRNYLHIWTISSTGISTVAVAEKREDLRRKIRQYIEKCSMGQDPSLPLPAPEAESEELFSWLLQPVMTRLRAPETVVVDLDTGMTRLPLESLKSPEGWYFGERFPVSYSPGYLGEIRLRPVPQDKPRVGLRIYALPQVEKNLLSAFSWIKSMDGKNVELADFPSFLRQSEAFVFIGHGNDSGEMILREEAALTAKNFSPELLQRMQLAVLVGCSTGVTKGEFLDTSNLVRAFLSGGTPNVVASHWDVNMDATSFLMKSFSTHLDQGEPIAQALFEARKEIIHQHHEYAHPYYWAGFVLSGRA